MHIDECPKCGEPGYTTIYYTRCGKHGCKCRKGHLHGPYLVVRHYAGYDRDDPKHSRRTRRCYIPVKDWRATRKVDWDRMAFEELDRGDDLGGEKTP